MHFVLESLLQNCRLILSVSGVMRANHIGVFKSNLVACMAHLRRISLSLAPSEYNFTDLF